MEPKASFLQESDGSNSVTRLIVFIGAMWIMALITFLSIKHFQEIGYIGVTVMFSSMIGTLLTFKIIQKNIENKPETLHDAEK
jgi:amino acid transporter